MAYINGNKPIVTNGLVYALDFSNPKNSQNAQVVQSLAFNPFTTFVSGNLATPSISNNGLNFSQIALGAGNTYSSGDLITAFLSSSIPSITRNGTFTIAWTALVQNTTPGLFLTQNSNNVILHTRLSKTNTTLGFYDSGSNSLFEGKTYNITYGTTPNHCVWVYSSGSSIVYVNGSPITASGTFIQSGVADNRVFGLNGDPVRLNATWSGSLYNLQVYNRALSQNEVLTNYQNVAITFRIPTIPTASTLDPNTVLYTQRASITDTNTISSINTFVTSLKSANLWDKLTGIYPFTGLSTSSNAINLKDPGIFNLVYTGSWSGSTPSSSTAHIRTQWHPQAISNGFSYPTINTSSLHLTYLSYDLPQTSSTLIGQLGTPISASGGTITTSGNRTIHTFTTTGSNTFEVFTAGVAEVLVVAGGASGGPRRGGGGAGGVVYSASVYFPSGSYTAFVGDGGPATTNAGFGTGASGTGSYIYTVSASGGGIGANFYNSSNQGGTGGSSGGNGGQLGLGSVPREGIDGQGSAGGVVISLTGPSTTGLTFLGGGGGALTNGTSQVYTGIYKSKGEGGAGIGYSISGVHTYYGGGGGGGSNFAGGGSGTSPNAGGRGGGGTGGNSSTGNSSGSANTGGGGGSGDYFTANNLQAKGGSGIIIISYETSATSSNAIQISETGISASLYNIIQSSITSSGNIGLITVNRNVSSSLLIHKNNISQSFSVPATSSIGVPFYINALNNNFSASSYSPSTVAYASIGSGLTTSEVTTYHNLIGQLQANLKRQNTLLDNYSGAAAAYSLRRIGPSNYFGPAIRVRRDSDNTLRDIGFTSDGQLDTVGLLDFVGVTGSGFVDTWYDQSGNGYNATQATTTSQPLVISSGSIITDNNKNAIRTVNTFLRSPSLPSYDYLSFYALTTPLSLDGSAFLSYLGLGAGGTYKLFFGYGGTNPQVVYYNKGGSTNSTNIASLVNDRRVLINADANSTNMLLYANNTLSTTVNVAGVMGGDTNIGIGNGYQSFQYPSLHQEIILYTSSRRDINTTLNSSILSAYTTGSDTDYQAFITATGITQPTQSAALETLVSDLKSYGLWNKMKAIYPMITDKNNRFAYSQALGTTWNATNVYVTQSFTTAPDGTLTGNFVSESAVTDTHYIYQTIADGLVTGSEYVASIHGKFLNRPWIAIETNTGAKAWFNIQTGITGSLTGSNATITAVSGGWYRCALYFTSSVASGPQNIQYNLADADGNLSYAGVAGTGSYMWGAQFENGNVLGPYRATTTVGFTTGSMLDQMKYNLRNPADTDAAYRLVYSGSWNGGYSGVRGDGITAYADTKLKPNLIMTFNNQHYTVYKTDIRDSGTDLASLDLAGNGVYLGLITGASYGSVSSNSGADLFTVTTKGGNFILNRTTSLRKQLYKNTPTPEVKTDLTPSDVQNYAMGNVFIGALNTISSTIDPFAASTPSLFSKTEIRLTTIGDGLTDYEAKALYWIVQKYQTTLGRQVY